MGALRAAIGAWQTGSRYRISTIPGFGDVHVLSLIPRGLASCPDKVPRPSTSDLAFIDDQPLRDTLRLDLSAVNRALATDEWKAATVLSGSIVQALLLWELQQQPAGTVQSKLEELKKAQRLKGASGKLEEWGLAESVELAEALQLIGRETATQAWLAKDYRYLTHAERSVRLKRECDRGAALAAVAAVEAVVRDLARRRIQEGA